MNDYLIDEVFSSQEGKELSLSLIRNIIEKELEENYDECIVAFFNEFCKAVNIGKAKNNQLPISSLIIAEVREKIRKSKLETHYLTEINRI